MEENQGVTSPAWPEAAVDPALNYLQERYVPDLQHVDIKGLLHDELLSNAALVSSFGAESAVLLHLVALIRPDVPVLFIETDRHFRETLEYRDQLIDLLGLELIVVEPNAKELSREDPVGNLSQRDPNACCLLRKSFPLQDALSGYDAWISGRKRFQAASRSTIPLVERDGSKIKINPLALWDKDDLNAYFAKHDLPRHPLEAQGYPSIGCAPCTNKVEPGADPRSGRWSTFQGKTECGIHLGPDGKFTR